MMVGGCRHGCSGKCRQDGGGGCHCNGGFGVAIIPAEVVALTVIAQYGGVMVIDIMVQVVVIMMVEVKRWLLPVVVVVMVL